MMLYAHMDNLQGRDLGSCADAQIKKSAFSFYSMAISHKDFDMCRALASSTRSLHF